MKNIIIVFFALLFSSFVSKAAFAQSISPLQSEQVKDVISDQLKAFVEGDGQRAYSHATPGLQKIFPTIEGFMTMVERGYAPIYRSSTHDFGRSSIRGNQIYQELILTDQKGKTWQSIYVMEQQNDGSWKIGGVQMRRSSSSIL